tara:strand:+ start:640 stop:2679 length:2040 start_codon:yes stop_codon:yes gene_type:complete
MDMNKDTDDIFTTVDYRKRAPNDELAALIDRISLKQAQVPVENQPIEVPKKDDADEESLDEEFSPINTRPEAPKEGSSILMPTRGIAAGQAIWEELRSSGVSLKINRGIRAGLVKKSRYPQPIDLVIPYAGSEATEANKEYCVEDGVATGMLARQLSTAIRIQNSVGTVANTFSEPKQTRPLGIAIVSTLSDDDHRKQVSTVALNNSTTKMAIHAATKSRKSAPGALRPSFTDDIGKNMMLTAGEGITLVTMRTGKVGGGKSLTAYSMNSPRDSIDRQAENWKNVYAILESSSQPVILPPTMSIGGTSFDAFLNWTESSRNFIPPGAFQYITTQAQDKLEFDIAAAASRKKLESIAALTCIDSGDVINEIPIVMIDISEEANTMFVETEQLRLAMECYGGLQPALSLDRSDVVVKLKEYSLALGKGCKESSLFISDINHPKGGELQEIQYRDVYLAHATHMNRNKIARLATGEDNHSVLEGDMKYLVTRAFAQLYGRNVADIMLSDVELHREKIKMAQVVVYLPDDMNIGKRKEHVRRLQNTISQALSNVLGTKHILPQFITTYRIPMTNREQPIVTLRLMTHTKDIVDLIIGDTPEFYERILTGISLQEAKDNKRGRTKMLENKIWHNEIASLESPRHRGVPYFKKWASILKILIQRAYQKGWHPERKDAWGNGPRNV